MNIPPKIVVPLCIEQGSIYHFEHEEQNHDGTTFVGNHYFILLNVNPKTDEVLVLTGISSRIEKVEKYIEKTNQDPQTGVRITPADFKKLTKESIVNCNNVHVMNQEELIKKLEGLSGQIFFERLPKSVLENIIGGVMKSKQVETEFKKLIV